MNLTSLCVHCEVRLSIVIGRSSECHTSVCRLLKQLLLLIVFI